MKQLRTRLFTAVVLAAALVSTSAQNFSTNGLSPELQALRSVTEAPALPGEMGEPQGTNAPVIAGPGWDAFQFLTSGASNWMVAAYGIWDSGSEQAGFGLGAGYRVNDFIVPTMRLDFLPTAEGGTEIWMPSASIQLQAPVRLMGKLDLVPFGFAGIATCVSGRDEDNGAPVGIFGLGGAVRIGRHFDVIGDYEIWSGFAGSQYRLGVLYKF
jgi:hypothetical protein